MIMAHVNVYGTKCIACGHKISVGAGPYARFCDCWVNMPKDERREWLKKAQPAGKAGAS